MVNASQPAPASTAQPYDEARWQAMFARIRAVEGGLVNNPADPGGLTNEGLTLPFLVGVVKKHPELLAHFDLDGDGAITGADLRAMRPGGSEPAYRAACWQDTGFCSLPQPLDTALTDEGINGGPRTAVMLLQRALNSLYRTALYLPSLSEDGGLGPETLDRLDKAVTQFGSPKVLDEYRAQAAGRYRDLVTNNSNLGQFLNGWLARASTLGNV